MVRAEGVPWELGTGLGNPGGFSNFFGMVPARALVALVGLPAEAGICYGRDWGLDTGGRGSSEGGGKEDYKD